jgi:hypothetical protein
LTKSCQKVVKKLSKSCQKVIKKCQKDVQKFGTDRLLEKSGVMGGEGDVQQGGKRRPEGLG